jgi:uncharacterized SAM-binding protein YcdF (DUF218 family)
VHARFTRLWTRWQTATWLFALLCVASCGGQGDQSAHDGLSRNAAARFLSQATFGPTDREIDRVVSIGIEKWIDDQFDRPTRLHRSYLEDRKAAIAPLGQGVVQNDFFESFWNSAISADDQLDRVPSRGVTPQPGQAEMHAVLIAARLAGEREQYR